MAGLLDKIMGKFLMTINDHKDVRRIFKGFKIQTVATKYSPMNARTHGRDKARRALLIRNY